MQQAHLFAAVLGASSYTDAEEAIQCKSTTPEARGVQGSELKRRAVLDSARRFNPSVTSNAEPGGSKDSSDRCNNAYRAKQILKQGRHV
jgi:hypothetical protein